MTPSLETTKLAPPLAGRINYWHYAVFGLVFLLTVCGIFDHDFINSDELRESEISREFLDHLNSAVPTLNNQPLLEKPPLVYWTAALSLKMFGPYDWAARLPCLLFGWGILLFTYLLARRLYGREVALAALLVLATTNGFLIRSHQLECDIGLFFFVTGACYFLYRALTGSARWYLWVYLLALGAFFSKGFIGFVFPGLLFIMWIIWNRTPQEIRRARPWLGIPLILFLPIAFWFSALASDPRGNLLNTYLMENLLRFFPTAEFSSPHERPVYHYLLTLPGQFLPWIIILVFTIPYLWTRRREPAVKFLLSWFIPGFLFLSAAGTKRGLYLAPLLPPLAIIVAAWVSAKAKTRWLMVAGTTIGISLIIIWFCVRPQLNERESLRPAFAQINPYIKSDTKLYGFVPSEPTLAAVPFYTGHYFTPLWNEDELKNIDRSPDRETVIFFLGKSHTDEYYQTVHKYFKYTWLKQAGLEGRQLWVLSNIPIGGHQGQLIK